MSKSKKRNRRKVHAYRVQCRAATVAARKAIENDLSMLSITALRKMSRGKISGGYNMRKPDLVSALARLA